MDELFMKFGK